MKNINNDYCHIMITRELKIKIYYVSYIIKININTPMWIISFGIFTKACVNNSAFT
jgi:hypothetical protein